MKPFFNIRVTPARLALAVFLISGIAWAANVVIDYGERWVKGGGLTIGPTYSTANRITASVGCSFDYDFPSTTAGYVAATPNITCTGVKLGDPCYAGVLKATPSDAGSAYVGFESLTPVAVKDGEVVLRAHFDFGDAGAQDPPDAGYQVRCFSSAQQ